MFGSVCGYHAEMKYDPNERPSMGEVEVELEHALALHEEADCCR